MIIDRTTYQSSNHDARPTGMAIDAIVLHSTEGLMPGTARYLCNPQARVSAHYIVARTGVIYHLVDDARRAWHAGVSDYARRADWNDFSIGIEIEHVRGGDPYTPQQMQALEDLCRDLIARHPIVKAYTVAHRWIAIPAGRKIDPTDWDDVALRLWIDGLFAAPPPQTRYTEDSPILAAPGASLSTLRRNFPVMTPHYTEHDIRNVILPAYYDQSVLLGIDPVIAVAQMAHETGALTSWWSARPRRNPAGIGVTGAHTTAKPPGDDWAYNGGYWHQGVSFRDWRINSIPAHLGRLLAYATTRDQRSVAQQRAVDVALAYRDLPAAIHGSAPTLRLLGRIHNPTGQGWASPGETYGAAIADWAERLVR